MYICFNVEFPLLFFLQDAEGFAGEIIANFPMKIEPSPFSFDQLPPYNPSSNTH